MIRHLLLVAILLLAAIAWTQEGAQAPDPVTTSRISEFLVFPCAADIFEPRQCFLLISDKKTAILIDAVDNVDFVDKKVLIDQKTTAWTQMENAAFLTRFREKHVRFTDALIVPDADEKQLIWQLTNNPLTDDATGNTVLAYDMFSSKNTIGAAILAELNKREATLKMIIVPHGHVDHLGALPALIGTGAEVLMHEGDVRMGYPKDASRFTQTMPKVTRTVKDGELVTMDGITLRVLHTPGHSQGGICLFSYHRNKPILFSCDTLLYHSLGRSNFRDGSGDQELLFKNIREKLFTLPDETFVFTAHYDFTSIAEEKKNNPFLNPPKWDELFPPLKPAEEPNVDEPIILEQ